MMIASHRSHRAQLLSEYEALFNTSLDAKYVWITSLKSTTRAALAYAICKKEMVLVLRSGSGKCTEMSRCGLHASVVAQYRQSGLQELRAVHAGWMTAVRRGMQQQFSHTCAAFMLSQHLLLHGRAPFRSIVFSPCRCSYVHWLSLLRSPALCIESSDVVGSKMIGPELMTVCRWSSAFQLMTRLEILSTFSLTSRESSPPAVENQADQLIMQ
eukprot:gnl/TRDRNA2_/TRDRNA2_88711_c1_seq1.p1 gnl/TRDRNA2_/TRDRNA2_88711_c1~~gnl/TRDRNA2_/TRDRNA2_88711_c1_seq1.p1  ORF type:complete len:213 (+),score=27.94 gnl/TRDRNA2_/TRDRNA2_88711_c1_seq1:3-641(+)